MITEAETVACSKEQQLSQRILIEFPWVTHATYLVGRDPEPKKSLVFCDGERIKHVAAYQTGHQGWAIVLLPNGAEGTVLWPRYGRVRKRRC